MFVQKLRGERRLQFMLKQAEVFQHFAPDAAENSKKSVPTLPCVLLFPNGCCACNEMSLIAYLA